MCDKKGMILLESCLFFLICVILSGIVLGCVMALQQRENQQHDYFHDDEVIEIYEQ